MSEDNRKYLVAMTEQYNEYRKDYAESRKDDDDKREGWWTIVQLVSVISTLFSDDSVRGCGDEVSWPSPFNDENEFFCVVLWGTGVVKVELSQIMVDDDAVIINELALIERIAGRCMMRGIPVTFETYVRETPIEGFAANHTAGE